MDYTVVNLMEDLKDAGAYKCAVIPVSDIPFDRELRRFCEQNACGSYGRNYMCPPLVGDIDEMIEQAKGYSTAVVFQTVTALEDSYDVDGMNDARDQHQAILTKLCQKIRAFSPEVLALGGGGCHLCDICGAIDGVPCHHPELTIPSIESYGIVVYSLAPKCGMNYINGQDTVPYFGAFLLS